MSRVEPQSFADLFEAVIENPLGSTRRFLEAKLEGWVEHGPEFAPLPMEYGYIPGTLNPADGQPADVMVIGWGPTFPGCRYQVRPIGLLLRADGDHKVLAVPHTDEYVSPICDVHEVDGERLRRIESWFAPNFAILGWRDACWAREWLSACRTLAETRHTGISPTEGPKGGLRCAADWMDG
ncbi:MAG: inorganic diphosphatase [Chloroflexia bacterium]